MLSEVLETRSSGGLKHLQRDLDPAGEPVTLAG
jgi:hypothetical protein